MKTLIFGCSRDALFLAVGSAASLVAAVYVVWAASVQQLPESGHSLSPPLAFPANDAARQPLGSLPLGPQPAVFLATMPPNATRMEERWPSPASVAEVSGLTMVRAVADPEKPNDEFAALKRVLESTGIDLDQFLDSLRQPVSGEGGPFIALDDPRIARLTPKQVEQLNQLANELPLAAPLAQYEIGSPFGARVDPINHRAAFHPGLDLDAPYRTTVYSTGAGKVVFTGAMDSYGRVVEIDHGQGIMTFYAHLHRILVAKGETVQKHMPIGEVGATGRATGPHLHYEVRIDDRPVDPAKFMRLGVRPVFSGESRAEVE